MVPRDDSSASGPSTPVAISDASFRDRVRTARVLPSNSFHNCSACRAVARTSVASTAAPLVSAKSTKPDEPPPRTPKPHLALLFEQEPQAPPELPELGNVALVPPLGSATTETRTAMATLAADNTLAVLRGEQPPTP